MYVSELSAVYCIHYFRSCGLLMVRRHSTTSAGRQSLTRWEWTTHSASVVWRRVSSTKQSELPSILTRSRNLMQKPIALWRCWSLLSMPLLSLVCTGTSFVWMSVVLCFHFELGSVPLQFRFWFWFQDTFKAAVFQHFILRYKVITTEKLSVKPNNG